MRTAYTTRQAQAQSSGPEPASPAKQALLLAEATSALLQLQQTHYSPPLRPSFPEATSVAAQELHLLFCADFLPWLGTGEPELTVLAKLIFLTLHTCRGQAGDTS